MNVKERYLLGDFVGSAPELMGKWSKLSEKLVILFSVEIIFNWHSQSRGLQPKLLLFGSHSVLTVPVKWRVVYLQINDDDQHDRNQRCERIISGHLRAILVWFQRLDFLFWVLFDRKYLFIHFLQRAVNAWYFWLSKFPGIERFAPNSWKRSYLIPRVLWFRLDGSILDLTTKLNAKLAIHFNAWCSSLSQFPVIVRFLWFVHHSSKTQ